MRPTNFRLFSFQNLFQPSLNIVAGPYQTLTRLKYVINGVTKPSMCKHDLMGLQFLATVSSFPVGVIAWTTNEAIATSADHGATIFYLRGAEHSFSVIEEMPAACTRVTFIFNTTQFEPI